MSAQKETLKPPFPYFGGKSLAAELIWSKFGEGCKNYIEPFFGSGAVWLNRSENYNGCATANDIDGFIANFWRAMQADPEALAAVCDWPVNEADLHARHLYLVNHRERLTGRIMADPDYYDVRLAGWWAWGCCAWIGGGWCDGSGPWRAEPDDEGVATFTRGDAGNGVKRQLPHLSNAGRGVNRKLPHLSDAGNGVKRQLPHLSSAGQGVNRQLPLVDWFLELQASLRPLRVACGDWKRICSIGTMTRNGICAVLLDPPYGTTDAVYANDSKTVSGDVRQWCIEHGDNPKLRIALCGHDGEHNALADYGWTVETWAKRSGYQGADDRERIWFSPHCQNQNDGFEMEFFA